MPIWDAVGKRQDLDHNTKGNLGNLVRSIDQGIGCCYAIQACHTQACMKNFFKRLAGFFVNHWVTGLLLVLALAAAAAVAAYLQPVVLVIAAGQTDQDEQKVVQLLVDTDRKSVV